MRKMTKIKSERIADPDSIYYLKKLQEVKFLIFLIDTAKPNKYLKFYDPKQESKHIMKLDANNFYVYAISKLFSTSGLKWIDPK